MAFRPRNEMRDRGTIVFLRSGETRTGVPYTNVRIVTDSGPRKDYPMFRFFGELAETAAKFEKGDRVVLSDMLLCKENWTKTDSLQMVFSRSLSEMLSFAQKEN